LSGLTPYALAYAFKAATITLSGSTENDMNCTIEESLVPYAEAAKKKGIQVYHLNISQPDIETPQPVLDAVRHSNFKVLAYSHSAGNESYRKKLTEYSQRKGITVTKDEIIVTTGDSEANLVAFMACLDAGDEVIIPETFYANYNGFAVEAGVTVVPVTASIENGVALPSIAAFEAKITPKTKAILICNPTTLLPCS
jgi:aspartate aminotransferase